VTWLDVYVYLSCGHTSLLVTHAFDTAITVLISAIILEIAYHATGSHRVTLQMPSAETSTQLIDPRWIGAEVSISTA